MMSKVPRYAWMRTIIFKEGGYTVDDLHGGRFAAVLAGRPPLLNQRCELSL